MEMTKKNAKVKLTNAKVQNVINETKISPDKWATHILKQIYIHTINNSRREMNIKGG